MASTHDQNFKVEHVMTGIPVLKCLACIGEAKQAVKNGDPVKPVQEAVTLAPTWMSKQVMGQMILAAIAVPSCMDHIDSEEKSPQERAIEGGFLLGRGGNGGVG